MEILGLKNIETKIKNCKSELTYETQLKRELCLKICQKKIPKLKLGERKG